MWVENIPLISESSKPLLLSNISYNNIKQDTVDIMASV